jgi:cytochrome c
VILNGIFATGLSLAFAASAAAQTPAGGDPAAGEKAFVVCRACHQVGPTARAMIGPSLNGIVGRKAGTYPDYQYSEANKNSGLTWTPEQLDIYLAAPQKVVPRTKMVFPGIKEEQKRKDVIAYLAQFGPDGKKAQ